jgi:hypothetical protein
MKKATTFGPGEARHRTGQIVVDPQSVGHLGRRVTLEAQAPEMGAAGQLGDAAGELSASAG